MTARATTVVCVCLVLMWLVIGYVIASDTPAYRVPADIRPLPTPAYTPFTQTPH